MSSPRSASSSSTAIAQREVQVDPDRMLDDRWRKAVSAVGDFSHRASLPSASLPSYPITLTKPNVLLGKVPCPSDGIDCNRSLKIQGPSIICVTFAIAKIKTMVAKTDRRSETSPRPLHERPR